MAYMRRTLISMGLALVLGITFTVSLAYSQFQGALPQTEFIRPRQETTTEGLYPGSPTSMQPSVAKVVDAQSIGNITSNGSASLYFALIMVLSIIAGVSIYLLATRITSRNSEEKRLESQG